MSEGKEYMQDTPDWYKDAVIYELHIKSFFDSDGDGIGDFKGLIQKLDYLEGLGVTAIWILPFYPSPLRDDGYDIGDYFNIHSDYGAMRDFRRFLREAHKRGLRVITELVVNHTSDQHKWFQRARKSRAGSVSRDYYVWSDSPEKYSETRIIFKDFETSNWSWDPVAKAYYWHRFYSHQPDLNFDNPKIQKEIFRVMDFWFGMGVDGMRLDAIPYLFQREGTNCENLPETHEFLKKLRAHVDSKFEGRMFLAEANQWPEEAAAYFGNGDECHMAFHFPVMPRLFMAMRMEDRFPIIDILEQTPQIPDNCQWAMFLRNHDELTLEMVTDEERDYMYRIFAQDPRSRINLGIRRRLAPLLENNRRKIELMNILLFSLPGTPVIYYGDEIGMGDNYYLGDRDGVRTPMQWSADRNAGFSRANPQKLYLPVIIDPDYHFEALNVENQEKNLSSLLWWMKRVIAMRKHHKSFGRGSLEFIPSENAKVITFLREYGDEIILVICNLSRFTQVVSLNLETYLGYVPRELFSHTKFPVISQAPYVFSLGPYGHYWLQLEQEKEAVRIGEDAELPVLELSGTWKTVLSEKNSTVLEKSILPTYLMQIRWFGGKGKNIRRVRVIENISVSRERDIAQILILEVQYTLGLPDSYLLPLSFADAESFESLRTESPQSVIAKISVDGNPGFLYDAIYKNEFRDEILSVMMRRRKLKGQKGALTGVRGKYFRQLMADKGLPLASRVLKAEQSNSSFLYEDNFFLKLYRRVEEGVNPDAEIVRYLTEVRRFEHVPPFAGGLEYQGAEKETKVMALLQGIVHNEGDAWSLTLDAVSRYFERVLSVRDEKPQIKTDMASILQIDFDAVPDNFKSLIGTYLEKAFLLGQRTGEMHLALAKSGHPDFAPDSFSMLYQKSLYQSLRNKIRRSLQFLKSNMKKFPDTEYEEAEKIISSEKEILSYLKIILKQKIFAQKIRIHGDYHLGQVLYTGKDFIIIDFEGEPAVAPSERRLKYSSFRDLAGMIRSFHYAVYSVFFQRMQTRPEDEEMLIPWLKPWYHFVSGVFMSNYMNTVREAPFVPKQVEQSEILLKVFSLQKAFYELEYELNNRPDWVAIPMEGINMVVQSGFEN